MAGPTWMQHPKVMRLRDRFTAVDIGLDVMAGFREHRSGRSAAALTYYGFLSLFPLAVVLTTILGFLLDGNPEMREWIGEQIASDPESLNGSIPVLVVGTLVALWSGTRAFVGLQQAFDDIAGQPLDDRANLPITRLRALLGIAIIGISQIGTAVLASLATLSEFPGVSKVLLGVGTLVVNVAALAAVMRFLRSGPRSWRAVFPGAAVGGVLFTVLQFFGTAVVGRAIANASNVYGTFASVIGLLTWLNFHAMIAMYAAELNQVLVVRRQVDSTVATAVAEGAAADESTAGGSAGDDDADAAKLA
jgi:membrane protein